MNVRIAGIRSWRPQVSVGVAVLVGLVLALVPTVAVSSARGGVTSYVASPAAASSAAAPKQRPNVVFVVLDDFSVDLTQTLRSARWMARRGASYAHAFVVDSLCCVSRASTLTGQYPHQTGVETNMADPARPDDPQGGFRAFHLFGNERRSFAVGLQQAGYRTGYVGKYLNQYEPGRGITRQPGWTDEQVVFGSAYDGWGFARTDTSGGGLRILSTVAPPASASPATKDAAYAGTVIGDLAADFVAGVKAPYFLQVAPYAPHSRVDAVGAYPGDPVFPAAFRDRPSAARPQGNCGRVACGSLTVRDLKGYGDPQRDNRPRRRNGEPGARWNPAPAGLARGTATTFLRDRARMAQSADRMLMRLLHAVDLDDTYVVLTSDNGFHLGQHGLAAGKGSPYDTDIRVPLLVVGPDVEPGRRGGVVTNLDLAATFEDIAGVRTPSYRSGISLLPSLRDRGADTGDYAFVEHTWARAALGDPDGADPDRPAWERAVLGASLRGRSEMDRFPSYVAVRARRQVLIRFDLDRGPGHRYVYEFYDLRRDGGFERTNRFGRRGVRDAVRELMRALRGFDACAGARRSTPVSETCRDLRFAPGGSAPGGSA